MAGGENRHRLVDDVIGIRLHAGDVTLLQELHDPARIEVHAEADAAAILREVFDRESQSAWAGGAEHQPVRAARKVFVRQRVAEILVVGPVVLDDHAALGNAGRAAGLEDVHRLVGKSFRNPTADRAATKPLVLEVRELLQILETVDLFERVEFELTFLFQPERATGLIAEVPADGLAGVFVEQFLGFGLFGGEGSVTHGESISLQCEAGSRTSVAAVGHEWFPGWEG